MNKSCPEIIVKLTFSCRFSLYNTRIRSMIDVFLDSSNVPYLWSLITIGGNMTLVSLSTHFLSYFFRFCLILIYPLLLIYPFLPSYTPWLPYPSVIQNDNFVVRPRPNIIIQIFARCVTHDQHINFLTALAALWLFFFPISVFFYVFSLSKEVNRVWRFVEKT